ncbi:MAG TPA: cupin domain-containing protein [Candidatus Woesebacteria bacterium]|nr:cupin domain-containing protein [Candidatus Woesebacteria bacterium]
MTKNQLIEQTEKWLVDNKLVIASKDLERPWGAFWHISADCLDTFLKLFFPNFQSNNQFISPKILIVEPDKKLSLQIHNKRDEEWYVVQGPVKVIANGQEFILNTGESITLKNKENHRLCGFKKPGIIAEIWKHLDPSNPSTEDDIVRLDDDFSRN